MWEEGSLVQQLASPAASLNTAAFAATSAATSSPSSAAPPPLAPQAFVSPARSWRSFTFAYCELLSIVHSAAVKGFAWGKLEMLEARFALHRTLNAGKEATEQKSVPHRDFYNVRKVDTHVHHSACMNQKHLLRFIKSKLRKEPDTLCIVRDGKPLTLAQVSVASELCLPVWGTCPAYSHSPGRKACLLARVCAPPPPSHTLCPPPP